VLGLGSLALGVVLMLLSARAFSAYFRRPREALPGSEIGAAAALGADHA
jgi:hypothetical protein